MGIAAIINRAQVAGFQPSDIDTAADTKYYGYLAADGSWYIMQEITTAGTFRYIRGSSAYITSWTGRAGLTYVYYSAMF